MNLLPMNAELLLLGGSPFCHDFFREVGGAIKYCAAEIQNKRPLHDGHGNRPIVVGDQLRNLAAANLRDPKRFQTKIRIALSK